MSGAARYTALGGRRKIARMRFAARLPWMTLPALLSVMASAPIGAADPTTRPTRQPVKWILPTRAADKPIWGIEGGIAVGLWHSDGPGRSDGPRGLIRIYTPYLDQQPGRIMNFIAVEPVVGGVRGLSEIETSALDHAMGKRITSVNALDIARGPTPAAPAGGVIDSDSDVEFLTLHLDVERFDNGAHPLIEITIRSDRPHDITLSTFAAGDSKPMQSCVLTATMGNYARLRHLQLADRTIEARDVLTQQKDHWDFYPWHEWDASQLTRKGNEISASATGDPDAQPTSAPLGWQYEGAPAVQSWTTAMRPGVKLRVNGRSTFWATKVEIPGGPAFENFELMKPFESGETYRFSVEPAKR